MSVISRDAMSLRAEGPLLDVLIAPPETFSAASGTGSERAIPLRISAMVDTGATRTVLTTGLVQKLGLPAVRRVRMHSVGLTDVEYDQYRIHLTIADEDVSFPNLLVTEASLEGQHIECLIGRDILMDAVFTYDGPANAFTLSF